MDDPPVADFKYLRVLIDGATHGQMVRLGKMIGENGKVTYSPCIKELARIHHWKLAVMIYKRLLQLKYIDGILHCTSLRRMPAPNGLHCCLLVFWQRSSRGNYEAYEIDPSKGPSIT